MQVAKKASQTCPNSGEGGPDLVRQVQAKSPREESILNKKVHKAQKGLIAFPQRMLKWEHNENISSES